MRSHPENPGQSQHRDGIVVLLPDAETARHAIEDLEDNGIPADSISLEAPLAGEGRLTADPSVREQRPIGEAGSAILLWGMLGLVIGAAVGALIAMAVDWTLLTGMTLGAVFGAAVGGCAGGMSVAKYASPARPDTYLAEGMGQVAVTIRHTDPEVVQSAASLLEGHDSKPPRPLGDG